MKREVGIPAELTARLLSSLAGVDYLGSLLKVDAAVDEALRSPDLELEFERAQGQGNLFSGFPAEHVTLSIGDVRATVLDRLERFLARHSSADDLGLRLDGEQLAAGVRFVRMAKEGTYDVVVGNPPYQGLGKTEKFGYVAKTYPRGKADLYAAFLEGAGAGEGRRDLGARDDARVDVHQPVPRTSRAPTPKRRPPSAGGP